MNVLRMFMGIWCGTKPILFPPPFFFCTANFFSPRTIVFLCGKSVSLPRKFAFSRTISMPAVCRHLQGTYKPPPSVHPQTHHTAHIPRMYLWLSLCTLIHLHAKCELPHATQVFVTHIPRMYLWLSLCTLIHSHAKCELPHATKSLLLCLCDVF